MLRPAANQIITKNESIYSLVMAVSKRAREIVENTDRTKIEPKQVYFESLDENGMKPEIPEDKNAKSGILEENPVKTAVAEFASGKYRFVDGSVQNNN